MDLDIFYSETLLDYNTDIVIKRGAFNWEKELSAEEKIQLHNAQSAKRSKGKGKGKRSIPRPEPIEEQQQGSFALKEINLKVKKVSFFFK